MSRLVALRTFTLAITGLSTTLCSGVFAQGKVWTVGPSGADFTQVQPAVDAAADGDLILVKPGSYAQFHVQDRGLTVVAEVPGSVSITGPVRVTDLAEGKRVALIDLSATATGTDALMLVGNEGSVRVRGGTWRAADKAEPAWVLPPAGARILNSPDVALRSMTLQGGDGVNLADLPFTWPAAGGAGLIAVDSGLALYHCTLIGGDGGGDHLEEGYGGGSGGHGLHLRGGFVHLVSTTLQGGNGGDGGDDFDILFCDNGGQGGSGGHGVRLEGGAAWGAGAAEGRWIAIEASGGLGAAGGFSGCGSDGSPGAPGQPVSVAGDAVASDLPGPVVRLVADGLWRPGTPETLTVIGTPGDQVVLALSPKAGFVPQLAKQGVLLLGGKPALKPLGTIPAGGVLTHTWTQFPLPPGWEGRTLELQAWAGPTGGSIVLSAPATIAIVDAAF